MKIIIRFSSTVMIGQGIKSFWSLLDDWQVGNKAV